MEGRRARGRQMIPIQRIERESDRYATFSKRRLGLMRKASEIITLCDVDIGVIIFSPTERPYSFFHPTMESVIGRVMSPAGEQLHADEGSRIVDSFVRSRVSQLNQMIEKFSEELEAENERGRQLNALLGGGGWPCDGGAIDNYSKEDVEGLTGLLENIRLELNG